MMHDKAVLFKLALCLASSLLDANRQQQAQNQHAVSLCCRAAEFETMTCLYVLCDTYTVWCTKSGLDDVES